MIAATVAVGLAAGCGSSAPAQQNATRADSISGSQPSHSTTEAGPGGGGVASSAVEQPVPDAHLVFHDSFTEGGLDASKWRTCYPWAPPSGCTNQTTGEEQWYLPEQVQVRGDMLRVTAEPRAVEGTGPQGEPRPFAYVSGLVATAGRFSFTYGYVEFRARFSSGKGIWPALWLLPADERWPPEIDVMESPGFVDGSVHVALHPVLGEKVGQDIPGIGPGWHTYAIDWEPGRVTWFIDGVDRYSTTEGVPDRPMYLLMNVAVGGWAGQPDATTPFPATLDVASVGVWQRR